MKNEINAVLENVTATTPEQSDYTGGDGLLYCGKCHKPKEAYFAPDKAAIFGRDRHPTECDCLRRFSAASRSSRAALWQSHSAGWRSIPNNALPSGK